MSAYSRVEINRMIESGVKFTVSTIRTPASLLEPMRGINLSLPVIAMDGAVLYNISENAYEKAYVISKENSLLIQDYLISHNLDYFTNVILEDVLLIYYKDSDDNRYNEVMQRMRKSPYRNYLRVEGLVEQNVVYFMLVGANGEMQSWYEQLKKEKLFEEFKITITPSGELEGCSMIKIYNKNATKENMLDYLKDKLSVKKTVTFGTLEGKYDYIIRPGDFNRVVKLMKKEL